MSVDLEKLQNERPTGANKAADLAKMVDYDVDHEQNKNEPTDPTDV